MPARALELYQFRFRDPHTRKWVNASYRASVDDLRQRYAQFEVYGQPLLVSGPAGAELYRGSTETSNDKATAQANEAALFDSLFNADLKKPPR